MVKRNYMTHFESPSEEECLSFFSAQSECLSVSENLNNCDELCIPELGECRSMKEKFVEEVLQQLSIFGESKIFLDTVHAILALKNIQQAILIEGNRGVGKKTMARLLHHIGPKKDVKCGVLDCNLLSHGLGRTLKPEAILHKISDAENLFLVIQHPEVLPIDFRNELIDFLLSKTAFQLVFLVDSNLKNSFLNSIDSQLARVLQRNTVYVPNLSERRSDLRICILEKLRQLNQVTNRHKRLSLSTLERLVNHSYSRNFSTLYSLLERLHTLQGDILVFDEAVAKDCELSEGDWPMPRLGNGFSLDRYLTRVRQHIIWEALEISGYNQSRAARLLGISPQAINKFLKIQKFELPKIEKK